MTSLLVYCTRNGAADFQSNMHLSVRQNPNLSTTVMKNLFVAQDLFILSLIDKANPC